VRTIRGVWGPDHLRAFEKVATAESQLAAFLRVAGARDEAMLSKMK
jgi:hypothetical protein